MSCIKRLRKLASKHDDSDSAGEEDEEETRFSLLRQSNGQFFANLNEVVSKEEGNLLVSPLSLSMALTVLSFGASGTSLKELRKILNLPEDKEDEIKLAFKSFTKLLKKDSHLKMATKLFVEQTFSVKEDYKKVILKYFDAGSDNVNFKEKAEDALVLINKYVDEKTNHLIPNLFSPGSIKPETVAILVNAVYFKSKWKYPFNAARTKKTPFFGLDRDYEVDMMYLKEDSLFYKDDKELNAELLQLPYVGDYTFVIILPHDKKGIAEVEKKIALKANHDKNSSVLVELFRKGSYRSVEVFLPKFTFEQTHSLVQTLEKMGIKDVFGSNANLSRISDAPLFVSDVIQKTYIKVDEYSTEAAAATGVVIQMRCLTLAKPLPVIFKADHPFLYGIIHKTSENLLFFGRFIKP